MSRRSPAPVRQRGGFFVGLVIGLLVGLGLALGVALYVTKVPNPFVNKVPQRPAGQDAAEAEKNRNWDPNSALAGRNPAPVAGASTATASPTPIPLPTTPVAIAPPAIDTAPAATRASAPSPAASPALAATTRAASSPGFTGFAAAPLSYFVQAGAYSRSEDAEQQRAKLALLGVESRLSERDQAGRTVYRVRVGPFDRKEDAEGARGKLAGSGIDAALVAVQK